MKTDWQALPGVPPSLLGESPFWHPDEAALYWCDIPGRAIHRWQMKSGQHEQWNFEAEPGCIAPLSGGDLIVAFRDGLFRFSPTSGTRTKLCDPPYDPAIERFNDGKADAHGDLWVGTIYEPRTAQAAALYRWRAGRLEKMAGGVTVSNGLAFSPDGRTLYWSDTTAHQIRRLRFDRLEGSLSQPEVWTEFPVKVQGQDLARYGGRPDGAAVDAEGAYWCAMFEGQRLLRLAPDGHVLQELPLPVRCATMPCFGGPDLQTLFVTTSREKRPAEELAAQPLAGHVIHTRVSVPGLPVHFAKP